MPDGHLIDEARASLIDAAGDFETTRNVVYSSQKVIHDTVWGTCAYEPWEASLLDYPQFQRLRGLRQTGLAYFTYPTAEHSRFQHTLGVVEAATRLYDSIITSSKSLPAKLRNKEDQERYRMLLRLAALVHDLGHSVLSHSSERVYGLTSPFPELIEALTSESGKRPGAAEVVVYLLVTSAEWKDAFSRIAGNVEPPDDDEWKMIGHWVMGQEADPDLRVLADIISGPIDADKLDYVFRDGYTAGVPVGYDLERLVYTVIMDPQRSVISGDQWFRLTIPVKGINALEQLVMGRLVLNSYLYHHQKCRAAETAFERAIAREHIDDGSILGRTNVWDLFALQDADVYSFARRGNATAGRLKELLNRRLAVRVVEFRQRDLERQSGRSARAYQDLKALGQPGDWDGYRDLIAFEDELAENAGLQIGSVLLDVPKPPSYADLRNLLLPGRDPDARESPMDVLNYRDWIAAYNQHRSWIRIYGPRGEREEEALWSAAKELLASRDVHLPDNARVRRSAA